MAQALLRATARRARRPRPPSRDVHELGRRSGVCVLAEPDDASPVPPADSRGIGGRGRGFSAWMLSGAYRPRRHVPPSALTLTAPTTWVSRTCSGTCWSGRRAAWTATVAVAGCTAAPGSASPRSSFPTRVPTDAPTFARPPPVSASRGRWSKPDASVNGIPLIRPNAATRRPAGRRATRGGTHIPSICLTLELRISRPCELRCSCLAAAGRSNDRPPKQLHCRPRSRPQLAQSDRPRDYVTAHLTHRVLGVRWPPGGGVGVGDPGDGRRRGERYRGATRAFTHGLLGSDEPTGPHGFLQHSMSRLSPHGCP